ncbi:MAG: DUF4012 domain-containing protein [Candidatus Kerfeldbacteria bacterium]
MSNLENTKKTTRRSRPKVETIRISTYKGESSPEQETIPHLNVLDLRSIVAKQEAVSGKKERREKQAVLKTQRKKIKKAKRGKSAPEDDLSVPFSIAKTTGKNKKAGLFSRVEAPKKPKSAVKPVRQKKQKKPRESYWNRPITNAQMSEAKKDKLPIFGLSFTTVGKPLGAFVLLALVFVLPASVSAMLNTSSDLERVVVKSSEEAFEHLQLAGDSLMGFDFTEAETEFGLASDRFESVQAELASLNSVIVSVAKYIPGKGKQLYSGTHLVSAGEDLAAAGEQMSKALGVLSSVDLSAVAQDNKQGLTAVLLVVHSALDSSVQYIDSAAMHLNEVSLEAVPEDKRGIVASATTSLPAVQRALRDGLDMTELLLTVLGHDEQKRYLVLFQNNYEMRPTGGFIGSLAVIDVYNGVVTGLDVPGGGVYDISGQFGQKLIAPEPLHLVNPYWNLQDANWFPHFPSSARKIQWFYEESGGEPVDGVITLVPSVIERMLEITGPIDMTEDYGVIIDSENFYDEVQVRAEEKYDVTRESKKILTDMTPILFNKLFASAEDPQSLLRLVTMLRTALEEKDILVAMNDITAQQEVSEHDWAGELKVTDRDYLAVIHANISGGKTDGAIEEVVKHRAEIQPDGSVIDTVTLTRIHKGDSGSAFSGVKNIDYARFYVPQGSRLLTAQGFDTPESSYFLDPDKNALEDEDLMRITGDSTTFGALGITTNNEFEKTVFGGWIQTEPGESSTVELQYQLPFVIDVGSIWNQTDRYSLLVQKQPGSFGNFFVSEVALPSTIEAVRFFPETYTGEDQMMLTSDYFAGIVLSQAD